MNFTIYKINTGEIIQSGQCIDSDFIIQHIPENCSIINLKSNPESQYVLNNNVIDFPEKPNYEVIFDYEIKQWIPNKYAEINIVNDKRNNLLQQSDWTQIPNNPLTEEKQQEWAVYRQQLRDITDQSGYPFNVIWPTQPE